MKLLTLAIVLIACLGCVGQTDHSNSTEHEVQDIGILDKKPVLADSLIKNLSSLKLSGEADNYESVKKSIEEVRIKLASINIEMDSLSKVFKTSLLNRIIPFWEGTEWSFEGHTSKPTVGEIACGYFVSTTLRDAGVRINRYKLAQQNPINEAKSLALNSQVKEISGGSTSENISLINQVLPEGIHFIGFHQSHVGYILKEQGELYLIHSNYVDSKGVEIEPISESDVFPSYAKFYIVELSSNEGFLRNWVNETQIAIVE